MKSDWICAWRRNARRICLGMYLIAALALLAQTVADPLLLRLGIYRETPLTLADFAPVGIETVDGSTVITATDDAQLLLEGRPMRSLWVRCTFSADPGEFIAFYQFRADAPYDARKKVYAQQWGDWYVFPLPYGTTRLRLDLGIFPSITVHFTDLMLNRPTPPALPTDTLLWAAVLPGLLFTVADWLVGLWAETAPTFARRRKRAAAPPAPLPKKGETAMTVTRDTIIADILQNDPRHGSVDVFLAAGMHCLGCIAAHGETVAEACAVHGVDPDKLVAELNGYFATPGA